MTMGGMGGGSAAMSHPTGSPRLERRGGGRGREREREREKETKGKFVISPEKTLCFFSA